MKQNKSFARPSRAFFITFDSHLKLLYKGEMTIKDERLLQILYDQFRIEQSQRQIQFH